ncbi:probable glutathione S-transferase [Quercus suber]|uniref:probable glutathione S-transferase n=1 Tax=Quercus suber TaxID=58331 RepID=UPI000CE181CA|nr:probable glutathione S-transferase [Quercus suber]
MEEVKLLGVWPSPYSYRVIWALELKGVKYEYVKEDLANKSDLLLRYNPIHQKVPVLVHNEKPIAESTVILECSEETWPHNPLLPTDPHERAFARFWIKFLDDKSSTLLGFNLTVGEEQENATKEQRELPKIIEEQGLGKKKYFGGDKIGLADLVFGFITVWLGVLEEATAVKVMKPAAADDFPRLQVWIENFRENSVIKANLPDPRELLAHSKRKREVLLESKIA